MGANTGGTAMRTTMASGPYRWRAVAFVAIALALLLPATALAAAPTVPQQPDVYVSGTGMVTVTWRASTDADGDPVTYDVYRYRAPVTSANIGSAALVAADVTGTRAEVAAHADEIAQSYVWFYAVRAKDPGGALSGVSDTAAPNLHGYRLSPTVVACTRCHSVHGTSPIDYRTVAMCYYCHGSTAAEDPADALGDRSTLNIKAEFFEYSGQQAGSVHRSDAMVTTTAECDACHTPHRSAYYYSDAGVYDPAQSYARLLRVQTGVDSKGKPTYSYYTRASAPLGNAFCTACHGATTAPIGYVGDPGAYDDTGGDHRYASGAAHGPDVVLGNATALASDSGVQCLACHARHGSAADKLIAYRGQDDAAGTPDGTYAEASLCFACHSAGTTETRVGAGYAAPYAWNDRDVEAEFARTSAHPAYSAAEGRSLTCANCHNVHQVGAGGGGAWDLARASSPANTKQVASSFVEFCLTCHTAEPPTETIGRDALVPHRIGFTVLGEDAPYFSGWDKSGFTDSGHYSAAQTPALCENCHDPHGSAFARLTAWTRPSGASGLNAGERENTSAGMSREENLCYQCHGDGTTVIGGVTTRRAPDAKNVITKATATYGHDPADTTGRHSDTETASELGGANRHAECEDCHNPHSATKVGGTATQDTFDTSVAGGAVYGVSGARPTYTASTWGAVTSYSAIGLAGDTGDFEAYLCFKCHSSNTAQPASVTRNSRTYAPTDVAREYNPSNLSYHNVLGQSTGMRQDFSVVPVGGSLTSVSWQLPTVGVFTGGYGANTMLTCTSCHTNDASSATQAKGPHGSSAEWSLDPAYGTDWKTAGLRAAGNGMGIGNTEATTIICAKCHDLYAEATGTWSNTAHATSQHFVTHTRPKLCVDCHVRIPHGWSRPRLLGSTADPLPYRSGRLIAMSVTSHTRSAGGTTVWACTDCKATAGGQHTKLESGQPQWP